MKTFKSLKNSHSQYNNKYLQNEKNSSNNSEINRVAFVLPRGYGSSVERNKSKRLSREAYRHFKSHLNTGYDMLILVYPGNDSFHSRCELIRYLFMKANLIKS